MTSAKLIGREHCPCCGHGPFTPLFRKSIMLLLYITGWRFFLNSGCRCDAYNLKIGGSEGSRHIHRDAGDIWTPDAPPVEVALAAMEVDLVWCGVTIHPFADGGIGLYATHTHLDSRGLLARWAYYPDGRTRLSFDDAVAYYGGIGVD